MKKLLIIITIALIFTLTCITVINGLQIGGISILGIKGIRSENSDLQSKIDEATKLASTTYTTKLTSLDTDLKDMKAEKQKYDDMVATSSQSEIQIAIQEQVYTVDKLWTKIGTLATDEGLDATFELTAGTREPVKKGNGESDYKYYNINFTVQGGYANISLYISDLENDSQLGFKIEGFKMEPVGDGGTVKATFVCKDIAITGISTSTIQSSNPNEQGNNDANVQGTQNANTTNTNNTTNTTNTNNTTNTTNTNNTTNTTNTANTTNTTNTVNTAK